MSELDAAGGKVPASLIQQVYLRGIAKREGLTAAIAEAKRVTA